MNRITGITTNNKRAPVKWGVGQIDVDYNNAVALATVMCRGVANDYISKIFRITIDLPSDNTAIGGRWKIVSEDYMIDWGDGSIDAALPHVYEKAGRYQISISGSAAQLQIGSSYDEFITSVDAWGDLGFNDLFGTVASCYKLNYVASPITGATKCQIIAYTFNNCESLTFIPEKLFDKCINARSFEGCFFACKTLISIPPKLFDYCRNVESFHSCFSYCYELIMIPDGLFNNCTRVIDFASCFEDCRTLTAIPEGLFDKCVNATNFFRCFNSCFNLGAIPPGLFKNCVNALNFGQCFAGCGGLKTVPEDLFANCKKATNFAGCFTACNLISIPGRLFSDCESASDFSSCFYYCTELTSIPEELFDNCVNAKDFRNCFHGCMSLTGEAPKLWEMFPNAQGAGCFRYCTGLSNYDEIPANWK